MRSQEDIKTVQEERKKSELLQELNPSKSLFFTCLILKDFLEVVRKMQYLFEQFFSCFPSSYLHQIVIFLGTQKV